MIAARRYMGGRWYMPPGVHDLWGVEPVRLPPTAPRWHNDHDFAWEIAEERRLNAAFEASERERCAALRVPLAIRQLTTGADQWRPPGVR